MCRIKGRIKRGKREHCGVVHLGVEVGGDKNELVGKYCGLAGLDDRVKQAERYMCATAVKMIRICGLARAINSNAIEYMISLTYLR